MGIVQDQHAGPVGHLGGNVLEIQDEAPLLGQGRLEDLRFAQAGRAEVGRVAGAGNDDRVAGVQVGPHQVGQPLLGADQGQDLGLGVQVTAKRS